MALTDLAVRNAKPRSRPIKLSDGGGLHLLINHPAASSGGWHTDSTADRKRGHSAPPTVTLADARELRAEAKRSLAQGIDPSVQHKPNRIKASLANTVEAVADELLAKLHRGRAEPRPRWRSNDCYEG